MNYSLAFESAFTQLCADEGYHSDNPADSGGDTYYGISRESYPSIPWPPTLDQAKTIYWTDWWLRFGFDRIQGPVDGKCFNVAPDIGGKEAIICLQRALRAMHAFDPHTGKALVEDGILGRCTLSALNGVLADLMPALREAIAGHYRLVAQANDRDVVFINGWLNRAYR